MSDTNEEEQLYAQAAAELDGGSKWAEMIVTAMRIKQSAFENASRTDFFLL